MTEHPLLLNDAMVRARRAGRKSQTRRPVPMQREGPGTGVFEYDPDEDFWAWSRLVGNYWEREEHFYRPPFGRPGDQLWIREAWRYGGFSEDGEPWIEYRADGETRLVLTVPDEWDERVADVWAELSEPENYEIDGMARDRKWRPSIHMPPWASRDSVLVKRVWCERIQRASHEDMIAEGIDLCNSSVAWIVRERFGNLWDSIYAAPKRVPAKGPISHYVSYPWEDVQETREHKGKPWIVYGNRGFGRASLRM